jgi:AAA domain
MNAAQLEFTRTWNGPKDEAYFDRLAGLDISKTNGAEEPPLPMSPAPEYAGPEPVRLTPKAGPDPATDDLPTVYTVGALAALPSADELYIIGDGILTVGGKLLLYAKSGAGKTTLLDFLAGPLSTGRPFLGRYPVDRPLRVLVVQGELSLPEMASHAQQLVGAGFDSDNLMFVRMTKLKLPEGEDYLRRIIARYRPDVLCLDPWYRLFAGESSDKPEQVGSVFDVCDRLLDEGLILAAVVVHHANVTGLRTAGSWVFEGWPSTILRLEKVPGTTHRKLTFEKIRAPSSTLDGHEVRIALGEQGYLLVEAEEGTTTAGSILAVAIVREAGGQLHRKALLDRLQGRTSCKLRAANKYLGDAVQKHLLVTVRDGNSTLYQLAASGPDALS